MHLFHERRSTAELRLPNAIVAFSVPTLFGRLLGKKENRNRTSALMKALAFWPQPAFENVLIVFAIPANTLNLAGKALKGDALNGQDFSASF
eukprot:443242-Pleurochrysis_carterae.AAC.1